MTGPEHYAEAERLLVCSEHCVGDRFMEVIAEAQVHATLALAAATAEPAARFPGSAWGDAIYAEEAQR